LRKIVSIIGLGYVGLPLAVAIAKSGHEVIGVDKSPSKVDQINSGISSVEDVPNTEISTLIKNQRLRATVDFTQIKNSSVVIICVPTPLLKSDKPDLSYLESATKSVAENLSSGTLIILESTVAPGTTRNFLVPIIESHSRVKLSELDIVFSPERIDPLNSKWSLKNTPKIIAGLTLDAQSKAYEFYSGFIDTLIKCESLEVAETAKLLENSFRLINISFINELSIFCNMIGIEIRDVVRAASTKPYGFMPFYSSLGIGGHCIPVDPIYLSDKARDIGAPSRFIDLANDVNKNMPDYFVSRAEKQLGSLKGKKVLVVGVSYKPNLADVRETSVEALISGLIKKGAEVSWHDDLVKEWNGTESVQLSADYDLAILATLHDYLDLAKLGNVPILNTRGSI
jgi:UDP-N-acetyl-D-glucosamine dehydrogenase